MWLALRHPATPVLAGASAPQSAVTPAPLPDSLPLIAPDNATRLELLREIHFGPWDLVTAVAWSPDGHWLAVAAGDQIRLLDFSDPATAGNPVASFATGALSHGLAFSPDGAWLAAGSRDGWLRAWRLPAGRGVVTSRMPDLAIQAHRKGVNAVVFSPAGTLLASGGNDAVARFWDLNNGELLGQMIGGTFAVPSIAFTPDGSNLAVVNGNMIRLREVGSERITGSFRVEEPLYSVAFSPNGRTLAATNHANQVLLWDPEQAYRTGREKYPDPILLSGHTGQEAAYRSLVWDISYNPDGSLLASAGGDGKVIVWETSSGKMLAALFAHSRGATSIAFRPDGRLLASGGLDGSLRIWSAGR